MHPYASHWHVQHLDAVPGQTGAAHWMDGRDFPELAEALHLPYPFASVLDVGCGTGRAAPHCASYHGVDIAESAVAYCHRAGRSASVIDGHADLRQYGPVDLILCMSVFTHIDRDERLAYLDVFRAISPVVLVDIIPGDGSGHVSIWTADDATFRQDCATLGWEITGVTDRVDGGVRHRYFALRGTAKR